MTADPATTLRASIVIPARDAADTIVAALDAVLAQVTVDDEVILVDDRSRDNTGRLAAATAAGRVRVVANAGSPGPAGARNFGASVATGRLLLFTDADDVVQPGWLNALVEAAAARVATGALDPFMLSESRAVWARALPAVHDDTLGRFGGRIPLLRSGNMVIERRLFQDLGGFDEALRTGEDLDLSLRLWQAGIPIAWAPTAVLAYRLRPSIGAVWRQGVAYGRGQVAFAKRVADVADWRAKRIDVVAWRRLAGSVLRATVVSRWRLRAVWLLAQRLGRLLGSVEQRWLHV